MKKLFILILILINIESTISQAVITTPSGYTSGDAGKYAKKFAAARYLTEWNSMPSLICWEIDFVGKQ